MTQVNVRVDGENVTVNRLNELNRRTRIRFMRRGVNAGLTPMSRAAKRGAPRQSGYLKKQLVRRVKQYSRTSTVWGAIGARNQRNTDGANAARYLHLVTGGTKAHRIAAPSGQRLAFSANGRSVVVSSVNHPGAQKNDFITAAFNSTKLKAEHRFFSKVQGDINNFALSAFRQLG